MALRALKQKEGRICTEWVFTTNDKSGYDSNFGNKFWCLVSYNYEWVCHFKIRRFTFRTGWWKGWCKLWPWWKYNNGSNLFCNHISASSSSCSGQLQAKYFWPEIATRNAKLNSWDAFSKFDVYENGTKKTMGKYGNVRHGGYSKIHKFVLECNKTSDCIRYQIKRWKDCWKLMYFLKEPVSRVVSLFWCAEYHQL